MKRKTNFRAKLRFVKRHTNAVSLDDYFAGRLSWKMVNVVITFDDGYKSWAHKAAPVLRELNLPATFFVSSGFLDLSKKNEDEFVRSRLKTDLKTTGGLTEDDIRRLAQDGFTIGGHTYTHANLSEMSNRADMLHELVCDKEKLESITKSDVTYFAYPFGASHNPSTDLIALLKEAGYKGAVTTEAGFNTGETNPHLLHRELTGTPTPICVFKARTLGNVRRSDVSQAAGEEPFRSW